MTGLRFAALFCAGSLCLAAQDLRDFEKKVTEFTLANGLHFIIMERHQVPVVSFHTYVNAGSTQDPAGQTGIAHILEHEAFKGTETIGTLNWPAEKAALDGLDSSYNTMEVERNKAIRTNPGKMAVLETDVKLAANTAVSLADPGEFLRVFQENGGVSIACHTSPDSSETTYSLPSNRTELWFLMESQRLSHPTFRDLYHERDNMLLEIQSSVDSKALAKLEQALLSTAFVAHPYRNPGIGWPSDVANLRRDAVKSFFDTFYVPANMVVAIAGDIDPANAKLLAERYFGPIPGKPLPPMLHTSEPAQVGPRTVTMFSNSTPMMMIAYKRPDQTHRDDSALDIVRTLLADGQEGLMYKELVEEKRLAQSADATATFPAGRYPSLFVFTLVPATGHSLEENQRALDDLLIRFQGRQVDEQSLTRVKQLLRARVARLLSSNQRLASILATYYFNYGDWRRLFGELADIEKVTPQDVQRVSALYFTATTRTVAAIVNLSQIGATRGAQ